MNCCNSKAVNREISATRRLDDQPVVYSGKGGAPAVFFDHFVMINGPPFQRLIDPNVDVSRAPRPCAHWLENVDDRCVLSRPWRLLEEPDRPLATFSLPRLDRFRTPEFRDHFKSAEEHAAKAGRSVIFVAHTARTTEPPRGVRDRWPFAGAIGSPAACRNVRIIVHIGSIRIENNDAAAKPKVLTKDQTLRLRTGAYHKVTVIGEPGATAIWSYDGVDVTYRIHAQVNGWAFVGEGDEDNPANPFRDPKDVAITYKDPKEMFPF